MEAVMKRRKIANVDPDVKTNTYKSDWEELTEWGNSLAKNKGLTKEQSRDILKHVRNINADKGEFVGIVFKNTAKVLKRA